MKTITVTLTSLGLTGEQYIKRLEKKGYTIYSWVKEVGNKVPQTKKGTKYTIAIIKGEDFTDEQRITSTIRDKAKELGYVTPHPEVGFLLREKFTDEEIEEMGLWYIVTMHEPIEDSGRNPRLLASDRSGDGRGLRAYWGEPDDRWDRESGFAFAVPQVLAPSTSDTENSLGTQSLDEAIEICKKAGLTVIKTY